MAWPAKVRAMTYRLVVKTEQGVSRVIQEQDVPDGEHEVQGHDGSDQVTLSVGRRGPDGRFVASATHTHSKEQ